MHKLIKNNEFAMPQKYKFDFLHAVYLTYDSAHSTWLGLAHLVVPKDSSNIKSAILYPD